MECGDGESPLSHLRALTVPTIEKRRLAVAALHKDGFAEGGEMGGVGLGQLDLERFGCLGRAAEDEGVALAHELQLLRHAHPPYALHLGRDAKCIEVAGVG